MERYRHHDIYQQRLEMDLFHFVRLVRSSSHFRNNGMLIWCHLFLGDIQSLPENLRCYHNLIDAMSVFSRKKMGTSLTWRFMKSNVEENEAQRRPGFTHWISRCFSWSSSSSHRWQSVQLRDQKAGTITCSFSPGIEHSWGSGHFMGMDRYEGGIYFASNFGQYKWNLGMHLWIALYRGLWIRMVDANPFTAISWSRNQAEWRWSGMDDRLYTPTKPCVKNMLVIDNSFRLVNAKYFTLVCGPFHSKS